MNGWKRNDPSNPTKIITAQSGLFSAGNNPGTFPPINPVIVALVFREGLSTIDNLL
jgi:hypothetical protein